MTKRQAERSERAAQRLERGLARSRAVVAGYRARLLLLREALAEGSRTGLRPAPTRPVQD